MRYWNLRLFDLVCFVFAPIWTIFFIFIIRYYRYFRPVPMISAALGIALVCLGLLLKHGLSRRDYMARRIYWQKGLFGIYSLWSAGWLIYLLFFTANEVRKRGGMNEYYNYQTYLKHSGIAPLFIIIIVPWALHLIIILILKSLIKIHQRE